MRRGQVVLLDIILALVILVGVASIYVSVQYTKGNPTSIYMSRFKSASDALSVVQKTRIGDVLGDPVVQGLVLEGYIRPEDYNLTVLDLLGTLWAESRDHEAGNLSESFFSGLMPEGASYELRMGGDLIYSRNISGSDYVIMNKVLVSGYMVGQPIHGYMSRAWLSRARGVETMTVTISPSGSGFGFFYWYGGDFVVEKWFYVPEGAENISAELDLSAHQEGGNIHVYMNGIHQFSQYSSSIHYGSHAIGNVTVGDNVLRIEMGRPISYHNHMHPGTVLKLTYSKEKNLTYVEQREKHETHYFPYVMGSPAAWTIFPVDIPKDSVMNSAQFHLEGSGVNSRIEVWVNDHRIYHSTSPPSSPEMDFDILPYLHQDSGNSTGETNIIAVYFDIRSDRDVYDMGARGTAVISNSSYVEIDYVLPEETNYYGKITHTALVPFGELDGQGEANTKTMYFDWEDFPIFSSYLHIAQKYSWKVAACAWHDPEEEPSWTGSDWSSYQVFKSRTGRAVPTRVFLPVERYGYSTTNWVKARDFDGSDSNMILPESLVELNFLVPSQVGYGLVFPSQQEAVDDAIERLNETISGYVQDGDIETETTEIVDVPTMWSLQPLEVRVW